VAAGSDAGERIWPEAARQSRALRRVPQML